MFRPLLTMMMFLSTVAFAKPSKTVDEQEISCMATVIAREAPDEPYAGKLAVATVVMNRTKYEDFSPSVCGVVYQRSSKGCQFSWVCFKNLPAIDSTIYAKARQIAQEVLKEGKRLLSIGNALYFHTIDCRPNPPWDHVRLIQTIGHHEFFVATR